ncbi:D-alanyl-D-alanine carboxypeptidase [Streptomyces sp. NBC_01298]|uniref:D-alanyl-D-alanine carboxypeptidase family protein n=1 Tax=Streptomyces sp. NBC_01298 TaxID=2903817 RepID=UPI002E12E8AA|nr:D-alanyl-D-alanine carboxypeptidase [Streptomyces sp. NBC_01298]
MFRAVKPGSAPGGSAEDSERTAVFRAVKPPTPAAPAGDEPIDSERTAVFRAIKPGTANPSTANPGTTKPGTAGQGTAGQGTAKPAAPGQGPNPAGRGSVGQGSAQAGSERAGGAERASTFVPLRSDDGPARPTAGAPGAPSAPAPGRTPVPAGVRTPVTRESPERTTQQPLPPKPPLDMLADLTNNPPPPPSAARTAVRRFKIYAPILVLLAVILAVVQLVRPLPAPTLKMTTNASYTFKGAEASMPWPKEGQAYMAAAGLGTVGTFGEQKPVAIGSVAKAMTAYVILKDFPMKKGEKGQMIPVDKTAVDDGKKETEGESTVNNLKEGDEISQYDALSAIMIPSANNVARLLARWDGGQEAFVKKMNDTARELGMTNTTYTDPSGLDATTVSTAEDQVKLGLKIVEMPELIDITRKPSWTDPTGKKWRNYNDLVPFNDSLGIKTGSTTKAGGNLLFAAEKKVGKTNQLIVGAVLGQHGVPILGTAIAASKDIMLATQKMLKAAPVIRKGDVVGYVDDGLGTQVPVVATADVQAVGWPTLTIAIKLADGATQLPQSAKAGSEIGMLTVGEGASQVKVPVALQSDLTTPGLGKKLTRVG